MNGQRATFVVGLASGLLGTFVGLYFGIARADGKRESVRYESVFARGFFLVDQRQTPRAALSLNDDGQTVTFTILDPSLKKPAFTVISGEQQNQTYVDVLRGNEINATAYALRNLKDSVRGIWKANDDDTSSFAILDISSNDPAKPQFAFFAEAGKHENALFVKGDIEAARLSTKNLRIHDAHDRTRGVFGSTKDGTTGLLVMSAQSKEMIHLFMDGEDSKPYITIHDKIGRLAWSAP